MKTPQARKQNSRKIELSLTPPSVGTRWRLPAPLAVTAPAGGRAPSRPRPSHAEPPPGQPDTPQSGARPCGAGHPAREPGVFASCGPRAVTGVTSQERSQERWDSAEPSCRPGPSTVPASRADVAKRRGQRSIKNLSVSVSRTLPVASRAEPAQPGSRWPLARDQTHRRVPVPWRHPG